MKGSLSHPTGDRSRSRAAGTCSPDSSHNTPPASRLLSPPHHLSPASPAPLARPRSLFFLPAFLPDLLTPPGWERHTEQCSTLCRKPFERLAWAFCHLMCLSRSFLHPSYFIDGETEAQVKVHDCPRSPPSGQLVWLLQSADHTEHALHWKANTGLLVNPGILGVTAGPGLTAGVPLPEAFLLDPHFQ